MKAITSSIIGGILGIMLLSTGTSAQVADSYNKSDPNLQGTVTQNSGSMWSGDRDTPSQGDYVDRSYKRYGGENSQCPTGYYRSGSGCRAEYSPPSQYGGNIR
jgi:hypothetical protein